MSYFIERFPGKSFSSLEGKLSNDCIYSAKHYSDDDCLEKTTEIWRRYSEDTEKEKGIRQYRVIEISSKNEISGEAHDSCEYHKKRTIEELAKYLPKEILDAEFGEITTLEEKVEFPVYSICASSKEEGIIRKTYYYPKGNHETIEMPLSDSNQTKASQGSPKNYENKDYPGAPKKDTSAYSKKVIDKIIESRDCLDPSGIPQNCPEISSVRKVEGDPLGRYSGPIRSQGNLPLRLECTEDISNKCPVINVPPKSYEED